jgi:hypothetical protein
MQFKYKLGAYFVQSVGQKHPASFLYVRAFLVQ